MKTILVLIFLSISFSNFGQNQNNSVDFYNLEDSIRTRLNSKFGISSCCPKNGAGYPTRNSSYRFYNLEIVGGRINIDDSIVREPIPGSRTVNTVYYPNNTNSTQELTHVEEIQSYEGKVTSFSHTFTRGSISIKGSVDSNTGKFDMALNNVSWTDTETESNSNWKLNTIRKEVPHKIKKKKLMTLEIDYTRYGAFQEFEGTIIIDGTLVSNHIMALNFENWTGPYEETCKLSDKLSVEQRTFKVYGRYGNIEAGDIVITPTETKLPDIEK